MATSRTRTRDGNTISGTGSWGGIPQVWNVSSFKERCEDVIGDYGGNHPLYIRKLKSTGSLYLKPTGSLQLFEPGVPTEWHNWQPDDWFVQPTLPSLVNRVLASTGPLTPSLNLPLAIFELRDVPRMIKHAGDLLHKIRVPSGLDPVRELAAANLAYKFGWAPLIQDLGKLLGFTEAALQQQRRIKKALSTEGLHRRVNLGSSSAAKASTQLIWSTYGQLHRVPVTRSTTVKTWATVRWRVRDPNAYGKPPTFKDALKITLGLTKGSIPIQVWKALPWTWMIDWFTDISNVLQANYNSIYFKPYRLSIMRYAVDSSEHKSVDAIGGDPRHRITPGTYRAEFKYRYANNTPTSNVTLRIPFLDSYKLSVLGSLAILKGVPPRGR